ncbi:MAG: exopolyphosphatase [Thermoleophilia bacterium]|nr:exopolyphosphatase [Thermoleophilia bacterium]
MKHRLVTRSDFDGLVCAVLLRKLDLIDDILFVHPKDVQDGTVEIGPGDILTNLPYRPEAHLVFDHHHSEAERVGGHHPNHVLLPTAPSAARVVYEYYGDLEQFTEISVNPALMEAVDKADSAQYEMGDILDPEGWTLLNFLMDSRTGLGRFREFRVSNYQLMMELIDYCIEHQDVNDILALPDVAERVELFQEHKPRFIEQLKRCSRLEGDVVVVDLREEETIHAGNRFMVYALFPQARVSVHVIWGRDRQNTVLAVGKSIVDRTSPADIGAVMLRHGGGGHQAAGTCQVAHEDFDATLADVVASVGAPRAALAA